MDAYVGIIFGQHVRRRRAELDCAARPTSPSTDDRWWAFARAWLRRAMMDDADGG
jgi:hypothetical protein